ncbi:MAG: glycosyltransferase, partial [Selenomonas sp.]|nr:glycosyltransferase [Selenomonas sp.]
MVTKSDYVEANDATLDASVVILTYNGEQHIDEILASLTTQRFAGTYE